MRRAAPALSALLSLAVFFGLSLVTAPTASAVTDAAKRSFIQGLIIPAQTAQRQYGIPTSVAIAQAAANTNFGTTKLATDAKNLNAIRCTASLSASQFARLAEGQVGKRYILGAEAAVTDPNPKAFDCSELVQWLYARSGNPITDLAAAQYDVTKPATGSPRPGDLVFLRNNPARANGIGHVAVVTKKLSNGNWEIIEARGHVDGVVKTTLSYWKGRKYYAGLRRYSKLNFVGDAGVASASAASAYQAGCISFTSNGKTTKYAKFNSFGDALMGHAAIVADGREYTTARKLLNDIPGYIDQISHIENPVNPSGYAKTLRSIIATYDLTQYDVAPLSIVLASGASGPKVSALQYMLAAAGKSVNSSGRYDASTVNAVKSLQSSKKLEADGQAGPITITALMSTVKKGDTTARVKAVNALLNLAGYPIDSSGYGNITANSIKAFQAGVGIPSTGNVDAKTWSRLFMLLDVVSVPTVVGNTTVGQKLTAQPGTWGPGKVDLYYQWLRNGQPIPGATAPTYVLQPADAGLPVQVAATGTKAAYTPVARASAATRAVTPAKLTATPTPKIVGVAASGKVLTAQPGVWGPGPVNLAYQWYRNGRAIPAATAPSYQLVAADYNAKVQVVVTGSRYGFYPAGRASYATKTVARGDFSSLGKPGIVGNLAVGQVLTAKAGAWLPAPTGFAYQWYRDQAPIKGATTATYKLTVNDAGHSIKVAVSSTGAAFNNKTRVTASTAAVPLLGWAAAPNPTLGGSAKVNKTLYLKLGTWSPAPQLSYQWYRGTTPIKGATKASYRLIAADKGQTITARVTASKLGYVTIVKWVNVKAS